MANPLRASTSEDGNTLHPPPGIIRESKGEEFDGFIAAGGYGEVYRIRKGRSNISSGKVFARKVMRMAYSPANQKEVQNEAQAVTLLCTKGHPNIIEVFDHGHLSFVNYYIDMELCDTSLADLLKREKKKKGMEDWYLQWPIENFDDRLFFILALMQELSNGLYFIHGHGQVHRDIKPDNVLYSARTGWWKLTDFGITTPATTTALRPTEGSRATACYAPPELLLQGKFNKKTDIWAMGCILYELCTGLKAFDTPWATITYAQAPSSSSLSFTVPFTSEQSNNLMTGKINSLIDSMIQIDSQHRCNAHELCVCVNHALRFGEGRPSEARGPTIFLEPSQFMGTEVPVRMCLLPAGIDQIIPPAASYSDFPLITERLEAIAKRREATYGSQHPLTIWVYLYLAYTQNQMFQHQAALRSLSFALLFNYGNAFNQKTSHVAILVAFCVVTAGLDREAGYKMFNQLLAHASSSQIELDVIEKLSIEVGLLAYFSKISHLRPGFALDLVERLRRQENVGPNHILTITAKFRLGCLEAGQLETDRSIKELSDALTTARKSLPPGSRDALVIESYLALEYASEAEILEPPSLMTMLKLLLRQLECFGPNQCSTLTVERIRSACLVLENTGRQTHEARTVLAIANELMSAYAANVRPVHSNFPANCQARKTITKLRVQHVKMRLRSYLKLEMRSKIYPFM